MVSDVVRLKTAWILPLAVIFWLIFQKILLPKIKSSSGKEGAKEKEPAWKKYAILDIIRKGVLISIFVLLTLFLTSDPNKYMGFPTSIRGAIVDFGVGGLIGISIWIPYFNIPRIWRSEKEKLKKMFGSIPGPKETQKYWVPITTLLGAFLEEIFFRGALIAAPAALLTFPYDLWVIFILVSSFFAALHVISQGPEKWDRKIDLIRGVSSSFVLGLIFIWRWSVIAAGTFHLMNNLIPWISYRVRE